MNDSKQLSPELREELFEELTHKKYSERIVWAVAECSAAEIDASNILQASLSAMARAVWDLKVPEAGLRTLSLHLYREMHG